jgi:hypothetical protein
MELNPAALLAQFEQARRAAIEATDRFHAATDDDATKELLGRDVVARTEASQRLLLRWLDAESEDNTDNQLARDLLLTR